MEWNSAFYIGIQRKPLDISVRSKWAQSFQTDTHVQLERAQSLRSNASVRRIGTFISPKWVVPEQTYPFGRNRYNHLDMSFRRTDTLFAYHFQCWIKVFSLFFVSFSYCFRPTSDLNFSFIRILNWTYEYIIFIASGRTIHSNHLLPIPSSGSRLKLNSNFAWKLIWTISSFQ